METCQSGKAGVSAGDTTVQYFQQNSICFSAQGHCHCWGNIQEGCYFNNQVVSVTSQPVSSCAQKPVWELCITRVTTVPFKPQKTVRVGKGVQQLGALSSYCEEGMALTRKPAIPPGPKAPSRPSWAQLTTSNPQKAPTGGTKDKGGGWVRTLHSLAVALAHVLPA